jgi:hypothetical protein
MTSITTNDKALCLTAAAFLSSLRIWGHAALLLSLVSTLGLFQRQSPAVFIGLGIVGLLMLIERYHMMRLQFDAQLFRDLAQQRIILTELDTTLVQARTKSPAQTTRIVTERIQGVQMLIWRYAFVWLIQLIAALIMFTVGILKIFP